MISKTQSAPAPKTTYQAGSSQQIKQVDGQEQAGQTGAQQAGSEGEQPSGLGEDASTAQQPPEKQGVEANLVIFDGTTQAKPSLVLKDFGDEDSNEDIANTFVNQQIGDDNWEDQQESYAAMEQASESDSTVAKQSSKLDDASILGMIQEMDYKLTKDMLDMIQRSLDRAKKLMEQNAKDYYQKVLPQLQAVEKQIKQVKALEASGQHKQASAQALQLDKLGQALQQALAKSPDFAANPAAKAIMAEIATMQQLSGGAKAAQ